MRFRKSIRIAPGVRINLSRSGLSTTLGGRGGSINIPGTGLSYSQRVTRGGGGGASNDGAAQKGGCAGVGCLGFFILMLIGVCGDPDSPSSSPGLVTPSPYSVPSYSAPVTTETREWFYIHGTLNVRAQPDKSADVVRTLRRGDYVQLAPKDANGWARLYSTGSAEGYVYRASELVRTQAPAVRSTEATRRGVYSGGGGGSRRSSGGRVYHTGPRGGCYYINGSGNKQYVDRSICN